jgi:hypothetical protein
MKKFVGLLVLVLFCLTSFSQGIPLTGGDPFKNVTYLKNGEMITGAIVSKTDTTTTIRIRHEIFKGEHNTLSGYEYETKIIKNSDISYLKSDTSYETTLGNELIKAGQLKSAGTFFCMIGVGLIASPYFLDAPKLDINNPQAYADDLDKFNSLQKTLVGVGAGLFIVGSLFHFSSASQIKLAGKEINLQAGKDGIGVKMNLNKN